MCGRFVVASSPALLAERFDVDEVAIEGAVDPDYNVAPRAQVAVVRVRDERRVLSRVRWGLVPSWAKDPGIGDRMINARAEGLEAKSAYKRPFAKKRCLIPADGFYEWQVIGPPRTPKGRPPKQPVFIHRRDGEPMAFAGLWDVWKAPEGSPVEGVGADGWLRSCAIVTTRANDLLMPVHDRMPVLLAESAWSTWLDPGNHDVTALARLLVPSPDDELELWPVGPAVSSADNNGPALVEPIAAQPAPS
jgi:putative SOS response-associated peptidase YedK